MERISGEAGSPILLPLTKGRIRSGELPNASFLRLQIPD
jgi:hypothetical protein